MKTLLLPLTAVFLLSSPGVVWADPQPPRPTSTGKVLLLENENTMEGDAERVGDQYRIRRVVGETWVPAGRVLCLCASMEEAFAHVRARANLNDPDERLRLARWCRANCLRDQALAEVRAAVQLRPDHAPTRRLLTNLEQSAASRTTPAAAPRPATPEGPTPRVDLTADCLGLFATRVQPILMNTCAQCHTPTHPGAFKLVRAYEVSLENRKTLEQNLAAVLAQVNFNQPQASPLLTKAVSDHARVGRAPLRGRQVAAYRTLEDWVRLTMDNNPQIREQAAASAAAPRSDPDPHPDPVPAVPAAGAGTGPGAETEWGSGQTAPPARPAGPADPFDPEEFNRLAHPDKPNTQNPNPKSQ